MYARHSDPGILLRQLLQSVGYPSRVAERFDPDQMRQVVYEAEVDGVHFTVTCTYPARLSSHANLSPREAEIIRLIIKGLPNKTIAAVLGISPWTVGTYIKRIFGKLNVNCRAEMVAKVLQEQLIEMSDGDITPHL